MQLSRPEKCVNSVMFFYDGKEKLREEKISETWQKAFDKRGDSLL